MSDDSTYDLPLEAWSDTPPPPSVLPQSVPAQALAPSGGLSPWVQWGAPVVLGGIAALVVYGVVRRRRREVQEDDMALVDVSKFVRPEVFESFPNFTKQFEGKITTMYQDVAGLVTTGIGNLIDPINLALTLPWLRPDGTPATRDEITAEWKRVKAMPKALVASRYVVPDALRLSEDGIDQLVKRHMTSDIQYLVKLFPNFPKYPAPAQKAIMSMAWAVGPNLPAKGFKTCSEAIRNANWKVAADQCKIKEEGNPGVAPRNKANYDLFVEASKL